MPMSGLVDRTGCHEQKRPSIPSRSTERTRAYGRIYAPEVADGRKARGIRASDLFIAATVSSAGLPIYMRDPEDVQSLHGLVDVVAV